MFNKSDKHIRKLRFKS